MQRRLALVGLALSLAPAGCQPPAAVPDRAPPKTPIASATASPAPERDVARRLERAPNDCAGPHPRKRHVAAAYAPLVGADPLWAGFYASYDRNDARSRPGTHHGRAVVIGPRCSGS